MLVFFEVRNRDEDRRPALKRSLDSLRAILQDAGISLDTLRATIFGGAEIDGQALPQDHEMLEALATMGVSRDHAIAVPGTANFTNVRRPGEPAGPRAELFIETSPGEWLELATVVSEVYILESNGALTPGMGCVTGAALGLERLRATAAGSASIFENGSIAQATGLVEGLVDPRLQEIERVSTRRLVDGVRSLTVILEQLTSSVTSRRGARLRRLGRRIVDSARALGIENAIATLVPEIVWVVSTQELALAPASVARLSRQVAALVESCADR